MASEHPISINEGGTMMSAQHSIPITKEAIPSQTEAAVSEVAIPQYGLRAIFAVWAAAALPMAALAWLVAPALKDQFAGTGNIPFFKALNVCLTVGLVWQFVLVATLLWREQRTFRWSTVREALWAGAGTRSSSSGSSSTPCSVRSCSSAASSCRA